MIFKQTTNSVEREGKFYTPTWIAEIARLKIADFFGKDWTEEFAVWDCAAGSGNLLAGIENGENLYCSDIDPFSVIQMQHRTDLNAPKANVFQFDFLNGNKNDLPETLRNTPNENLLFFINPPYVSKGIKTEFGDLSADFLVKIKREYCGSKIACFTKSLWQSSMLRKRMQPQFDSMLLGYPPSDEHLCFHSKEFGTNGSFPILFTVWDTAGEFGDSFYTDRIVCRVIERDRTSVKTFWIT